MSTDDTNDAARRGAEMRAELDAAAERGPFEAVATAVSYWLRRVTPPGYMTDRSTNT